MRRLGGVVVQSPRLEEAPGGGSCRMANNGSLDVPALAGLCRRSHGPWMLTGLTRPDRSPELRGGASRSCSRWRAASPRWWSSTSASASSRTRSCRTTRAPRRNGATLTVLEHADTVVAVAAADRVGLQRFVRGYADLRELLGGVEPVVVVDEIRPKVVPGHPVAEIAEALAR